jgi:hypothetical protein
MTKIRDIKQDHSDHMKLELGIYLGFGFWNLGFQAYAVHC